MPTEPPRPYRLTIADNGDYLALEWLSDRYKTAELLYRHGQAPDDWEYIGATSVFPVTLTYAEHEAWEIRDALEDEDPPGVIPCASDSLLAAVHKLTDGIV
jgi:hypothetical protein